MTFGRDSVSPQQTTSLGICTILANYIRSNLIYYRISNILELQDIQYNVTTVLTEPSEELFAVTLPEVTPRNGIRIKRQDPLAWGLTLRTTKSK
jgi:hypothetical protein